MTTLKRTLPVLGILLASALLRADDKTTGSITLVLPERGQLTLTVDGQESKPAAGKNVTLEVKDIPEGKSKTVKISILIVPNNYTKITRPREVTLKAGDKVKVDLTREDKKLDDIVVRWVPTPDDIVDEMCRMAKVTKDDVIYDPGCGDAIMLVRPIKKFGVKKGIGIDIDPKMVVIAKKKAEEEGVTDKVVIREGNILKEKDMEDLPEASVVLLYIGDDLGARMEPLLRKMLKPGARIVSHRFTLGDWKPDTTKTVMGADGDEYTLHLWVVPEKK
jgi:uncharacterized protein (TIGR03000 family)